MSMTLAQVHGEGGWLAGRSSLTTACERRLVRPTGFEDEGGLAEQAKIRSALEELCE
jgi:hypothetical protein